MLSEQILRIPRDDQEGGYVLVNVASGGPAFLDLKLLATEGESPYYANLKQSRVQKFRAKAAQLDDAHWESLLKSVLLREPLSGDDLDSYSLEKLEVTANINDEKLLIIFRKNISGITQRLGEISLEKDEDQEIDAISWAATAVTRSTDLEKQFQELSARYEEQGRTIEKLDQQLENLIQAKIEHEQSLLERFQALLNAKKSKIRDLHRALASVKVDPQQVAKSETAKELSSLRSPAVSRGTKRKAKGTQPTATASVSTSDEEEAVDKLSEDQEPEQAQQSTPERSDPGATEDEDDDDDLDSAPIFSQSVGRHPAAQSPDEASSPKIPAQRPTPPPRRQLPFPAPSRQPAVDAGRTAKKTDFVSASQTSNNTSATVEGNDDDDDETSDDEL
ncbi:hypothetical protein MMC07_005265 [Pseudocyphellaria aurata]|nr:hypothetical protein [Pseudocyphellaria aurata]